MLVYSNIFCSIIKYINLVGVVTIIYRDQPGKLGAAEAGYHHRNIFKFKVQM